MSATNRVRTAVSFVLKGLGGVMLVVALLAAVGSAVALADRVRFGRGIMFADVEFLALAAVVCAVPGVVAFLVGVRLGKR